MRDLLLAANRRYLEFISAIDDASAGVRYLNKVAKTIVENERSYRGFNFFDDEDVKLFEIIARGEFNIGGFQDKSLRQFLHDQTCERLSRILKRLRMHGMIKRIRSTYEYYLTRLGRRILAAGIRLREFVLIPALASPLAAENA